MRLSQNEEIEWFLTPVEISDKVNISLPANDAISGHRERSNSFGIQAVEIVYSS